MPLDGRHQLVEPGPISKPLREHVTGMAFHTIALWLVSAHKYDAEKGGNPAFQFGHVRARQPSHFPFKLNHRMALGFHFKFFAPAIPTAPPQTKHNQIIST